MTRARFYLDIDGCVLADALTWGDRQTKTLRVRLGGGLGMLYKLDYSRTQLDTIETLRHDFDVELVILSTWLEDGHIHHLQKKLNALHGARWLPIPRRLGKTQELPHAWKLDALLADQADNPGPFIWADDDEVPVHGETVAGAVSEPVLLLAPTSGLGLTPAHLEQARAFLAGLPRMEGA